MNALYQIAIRIISLAAMLSLAACLSSEEPVTAASPNDPPGPTNSAPSIAGAPSTSIKMGDAYSFTPSASDPENDPLTFNIQGRPAWLDFNSNIGALTGTPLLADIGTYPGIVISVSDGSTSSSLPQFTLAVVQNADGTITLSWTAPTENEDGTALTNLDAYKIYYGTSPGNYSSQVNINSGGITTYVLDNLSPATYYIVATAINSSGTESIFSNEITKQVL